MRPVVLGVLAACSYDAPVPGDTAPVALVHDSVEDFAAGALTDGVVTPWGTIEPSAFVVGGLHARAFAGNHVADNDTFDDVVAKLGEPLGAAYRQQLVDHGGDGRPRGLGLASSDQYTVLYDGEVFLPRGLQQLELVADDRALVQVATDGATFGTELFSKGTARTITFDLRDPGWYPIRIAFGQGGGGARLLLTTVQNQARTPVGASRLRVPVTDRAGLIAFGFDGALVIPRGETAVASLDAAYAAGAPAFDLDLAIDRFTVRSAGQLRIDEPGTYTFDAELGAGSDDSYRLWIDDQLVASTWAGAAMPSGELELAPGWHDLVLDHADEIGLAEIHPRMNGEPIAPERLRPAVARGLVATHVVLAEIALVDLGEVVHPLSLIAPEDAVIDTVDYGFGTRNHVTTDLVVELADCLDPQVLPAATTTPTLATYYYFHDDVRCAGTPVSPTPSWSLRLADTQPGNGGLPGPVFWNPLLVASYHGGDRTPFAPNVAYISAPIATPGAVAIEAARVVASADGARVELAIRTAPDEATLEATPWTVIGEDLGLPAANELLQYQLVISGDGWQYASIDRVELEYAVPR